MASRPCSTVAPTHMRAPAAAVLDVARPRPAPAPVRFAALDPPGRTRRRHRRRRHDWLVLLPLPPPPLLRPLLPYSSCLARAAGTLPTEAAAASVARADGRASACSAPAGRHSWVPSAAAGRS